MSERPAPFSNLQAWVTALTSLSAGAEDGVTILTPTTGRRSLHTLMASIDAQQLPTRPLHILLWDAQRAADAPAPESLDAPHRWSLVLPPGFRGHGLAPGSALRAVGLMLVCTPWVTFADDDVRWEPDHLAALLTAVKGLEWASTLRRVWTSAGEPLGIDRFESVGDDPGRLVIYEMIDNNCMLFRRAHGVAAAPLYRQTAEYNDDRLMYAWLKAQAGARGSTGRATLHQICPPRLVEFFRAYCSPA